MRDDFGRNCEDRNLDRWDEVQMPFLTKEDVAIGGKFDSTGSRRNLHETLISNTSKIPPSTSGSELEDEVV